MGSFQFCENKSGMASELVQAPIIMQVACLRPCLLITMNVLGLDLCCFTLVPVYHAPEDLAQGTNGHQSRLLM